MNIGIYFTANKNNGGVYQYSVTFLEVFSKIKDNNYYIFSTSKDIPEKFRKFKNFHFINLYSESRERALKARELVSYVVSYLFPIFFKIIYKLGLFGIFKIITALINKNTIRLIESKNLDLIFYPTTSNLSFLINVPSVVTIHDLHHKITPWFKETTAGGRREMRDYTFTNTTKKSYMLITESQKGKKDLLKYYKVDKNKILVLPMLPPSYLDSNVNTEKVTRFLRINGIRNKYIFYPAKFWPHKNHLKLIKALHLLKLKGMVLDLVLTGSKDADFSSFNEVMKLAKKLEIQDQIKYLGLVSNDELSILYKGSLSLVMPTFFGPSNLPVLEAWKVGTAVIYSSTYGCKDQLGDAGLLIDPNNYKDIANKIEKIYNDPQLRSKLIARGKKRLVTWTENDFVCEITKLIKSYYLNKYK